MKRLFTIITIAWSVASCAGKLELPEDPQVTQTGRYEFTAQVASLADPIVWTEGKAVGVYGSVKGDNAKYVPYNEFSGKSGQVKLYGEAVEGEVVAYFPYSAEGYAAVAQGKCPYNPVQNYYPTAAEHYASNVVLVADEKDGNFDFIHRAGLLHFEVNVDFEGEVKSLQLISGLNALSGNFPLDAEDEITDPEQTVTVRGMGKPIGKFDVWFVLPAGSYETLQLVVMTDQNNLTKPVNGVVPVRAGEVTNMTVVDEAYEYTGSDFEKIPGIFD